MNAFRWMALTCSALVQVVVWHGDTRIVGAQTATMSTAAATWHQWGGPHRNFTVDTAGLAEKWPDGGPPVLWSRPLGAGHSTIVADEGRLFTMYRVGSVDGRGPWREAETVVALDAATGKTLWEYTYPSKIEDFSRGAGPHTTPLVVGDRLFAFGTNKQLHAFDKHSGRVLWAHDLVKEFGAPPLLIRPVVKVGYGCSPIAYRDTIICFVGGPGQSVMAFRQRDGSVAWKSGHFLTSDSSPLLVTVDGLEQLVFLSGATIDGLDPATGQVLWSHPHDPGNDLNIGMPLWGSDAT
jgi:outer membrane protein assembly factor BamB